MADTSYFTVPRPDRHAMRRLFSKINVDPRTGCWNWTAAVNHGGYGKVTYAYNDTTAHRVMYAWLVGPIARGGKEVLDHVVCNNRRCCNPAHLVKTTSCANVLRSETGPCAVNARKTHCKRGHLLPLTRNRNGSRVCGVCQAAHGRQRYQEHRAEVLKRQKVTQVARMNGPRREELLAMKRAHYHAHKVLKRPHEAPPAPDGNTHQDP